MAGWSREHFVKPFERSSLWSGVRSSFMKTEGNDCCAVCGKKGILANLQVHHKVPFSVDPSRELDMKNLITLCDAHHLLFGHLGNFQSWNPTVEEDCRIMFEKIKNRPNKKDDDAKVGLWKQYMEFQNQQINTLKEMFGFEKRS